MDPMTLSLNTTRGKAMHAVFRYALWVLRVIGDRPQVGMGTMPEVATVLERHLDPTIDPSPSIRSVYGQWLPQLTYLDSAWVTSHEAQLFPADEDRAGLRDAAWDTYVVLSRPFDSVLRLLEGQYRRAIERLDRPTANRTHLGNPQERLGEHLMTWYWHGKLRIDDEGGLIHAFYTKASDDVRAGVMDFVGRSLHGLDQELPPEVVDRLIRFIDWRMSQAEAGDPAAFKKEMAEFGWWFVSKGLEHRWLLERLVRAVQVARWAEPDHLVMERLAELTGNDPASVLTCVEIMTAEDPDGWHPQVWRDELTTILGTAMRDSDEAINERARRTINWLGSRGYLEYRKLLM